jgi:hypothetical protein
VQAAFELGLRRPDRGGVGVVEAEGAGEYGDDMQSCAATHPALEQSNEPAPVRLPAHICWLPSRRGYLANAVAASRNRSFSSSVPMVTRTPSPANGRTTTPAARHDSANSADRSPRTIQTKLAWDRGTS